MTDSPPDDLPRFLPLGDQALTVEFGRTLDRRTNELVLAFVAAAEKACLPGVIEIVPTARSATLYFNPLVADVDRL